MSNPSKDHGEKALSYSPFFPNFDPDGGDDREFKSRLPDVARPVRNVVQSVQRKIASKTIIDPTRRDLYGRPRIVTGWAAILYSLARLTVIGVTIGFALAIFLLFLHTSMPLKTQSGLSHIPVASTESPP